MTFPFGSQAKRLLGVCLLLGGWLDGCDLNPQPHPPDMHGAPAGGAAGDFPTVSGTDAGTGGNSNGTGLSSSGGGSSTPGSAPGGPMASGGGARGAADAAASAGEGGVPAGVTPPPAPVDAATGCHCEGVEAGSTADANADALAPMPADGTDGPAFPPDAPDGGDAGGDIVDELGAMDGWREAGR